MVVVLGATFALGVVAQRQNLPPVPQVTAAYDTLVSLGDGGPLGDARHHLQPGRGQGDGVTVDEVADGTSVLMAGFFDGENQVRLVARDGTVERTWSLDHFAHFPDASSRPCRVSSPLMVDTHGLQPTDDGGIVVNYEYCGTVRLDACGGLVWALSEQTHHSIAPAAEGGWWILGRNRWSPGDAADRFAPLSSQARERVVLEDTILRVTEDGEVVEELSVPGLMRDGGLEALLTASEGIRFQLGPREEARELVHANKVAELPADVAAAFPMFDAGDLMVSLRGRNLVMVVDGDTHEVVWHQVGPWLRQHDPEFRADGRISVFNNNTYITSYVDEQTDLDAPFTTNITSVDPATGDTRVEFGEAAGEEMLSVLRGDHQLLDGGGMLITEFDAGRVLQVDAGGEVVWEYVNAHDDEHVGEITNALVVPSPSTTGRDTTC